MSSDIGFIILRNVDTIDRNKYWIRCYNCIRKFYPENKILIIDDNSKSKLIRKKKLYNTIIIKSKYPKRGELLPYFYYLKNKLFDKAIILHDSVFINKKLNLKFKKYKFLWEFEHTWDQIKDETKMIKKFNNKKLYNFYKNKKLWKGCFGCICMIEYDYLKFINNKYKISKLLNLVLTRYNRGSFERVLACLLQMHHKKKTLFGNIHKYCPWGLKFKDIKKYSNLPVTKIWKDSLYSNY